MNNKKLRNILSKDGYSKHTINSIMSGRRKPNPNKRFKYFEKYKIPFNAWEDIKSYLQNNDTKVSSNNASIKG